MKRDYSRHSCEGAFRTGVFSFFEHVLSRKRHHPLRADESAPRVQPHPSVDHGAVPFMAKVGTSYGDLVNAPIARRRAHSLQFSFVSSVVPP